MALRRELDLGRRDQDDALRASDDRLEAHLDVQVVAQQGRCRPEDDLASQVLRGEVEGGRAIQRDGRTPDAPRQQCDGAVMAVEQDDPVLVDAHGDPRRLSADQEAEALRPGVTGLCRGDVATGHGDRRAAAADHPGLGSVVEGRGREHTRCDGQGDGRDLVQGRVGCQRARPQLVDRDHRLGRCDERQIDDDNLQLAVSEPRIDVAELLCDASERWRGGLDLGQAGVVRPRARRLATPPSCGVVEAQRPGGLLIEPACEHARRPL